MNRYLGDLYKPWVAIERIDGAAIVAHYPPLLDMLADAEGTHSADSRGSSVAGSRAPLNLSALDLAQRIDRESRSVAYRLALPAVREVRMRLAAIAHALDVDDTDATHAARRDAEAITRRWWVDTRQALGIDPAPYVPHVRCPNIDCERWSTVRVALSARRAECSACGHFWDSEDFTSLASWLSWSSDHLTDSHHTCDECADEREALAARDAARRAMRAA